MDNNTRFTEIYSIFLTKIDDYELGLVDDVELSEILKGFLDTARSIYFDYCKKDIENIILLNDKTKVESETMDDVNVESDSGTEVLDGDTTLLNEEVEQVVEVVQTNATGNSKEDEVVDDDITPLGEVVEEETIEDWAFSEQLNGSEKQILALGMVKAWLSPKLRNADLMSKDIGDRDYKGVQGYNYLDKLNSLNKDTDNELRTLEVKYTYRNMDISGW